MKKLMKYVYYSFPVQLLLLHFRKSQILLFFWLILFLTITGHFMKLFGADGLFLAPEYLGSVNTLGATILGIAAGIFIMSWNITTFIVHSVRFRFLAATRKPFLKYCLNNSIIPLAFLITFFFEAYNYTTRNELVSFGNFLLMSLSFTGGLLILHIISFAYFFTADKRIVKRIHPGIFEYKEGEGEIVESDHDHFQPFGLPVKYYVGSFFKFRKARDVSHYSQAFLDSIFKRHHFSAMVTVLIAFICMIFIGFFMDNPIFQFPASASIFVMFALMIALIGTLSYFLKSWGMLFLIFLYIVLNLLYTYNIIDPRNKAYGLSYSKEKRPEYSLSTLSHLNSSENIERDKRNMISILNKWKSKQKEEKPLMIMMNFSGGGLKGASFSMNVLQKLDSATEGNLMRQTFLMSGASGGMLAAAYYRELTRLKESGQPINPQDKKYLRNISEDLLNTVFSSWITRDLIAPAQRFSYNHQSYIKDRGYAFEQKLNRNTGGILNHDIGFYKDAESNASIPLMILNSTVTRDLKKMIISTQPVSFLMQAGYHDNTYKIAGPDAIDFGALFKNQSPMELSLLSALRMNATYPYVLPSVWLPTEPVIDVMDAGLRDNYGQETTLRFINVFKDWINENTRGVLIIQVRSREKGSWDGTFKGNSFADVAIRPFSLLQTNWFRQQDYYQDDEITYAQGLLQNSLNRVAFMYTPLKEQYGASLSFHLTAREKKEVNMSLHRENNVDAFNQVMQILNTNHVGE